MQNDTLLHVENLCVGFNGEDGYIPAVDQVSFAIERGSSIALVGESGSGKSVTALSILRLLKTPPAVVKADSLHFNSIDLINLTSQKLRKIRGNEISMIFQEPMTSLNPLLTVGFQISESIQLHKNVNKKEARQYAVEMLRKVGISDPEKRVDNYPHQMSGGMRQRVMIAMAVACEPELLIADEPTTALDVTIQAQILDLIVKLQKEKNMALLMITHNLGIVAEVADIVMVMYAGQIVEKMTVKQAFTHPWHPYTHGLLNSIPSAKEKVKVLNVIPGVVPSPLFYPKGCRFCTRCTYATERCRQEAPKLMKAENQHEVRCFYPLSDKRGEVI